MAADVETNMQVRAGEAKLNGTLGMVPNVVGVVLFAHGSGSGRMSPRNRFVAGELQNAGLATLLIDLLEEDEAEDRKKVFDIDLLADRLIAATEWLSLNPETSELPIGYFGASTGAAAALQAAARWEGRQVGAIVSRGGRPDLAMKHLAKVKAPTLLIVGGNDYPVISMNEQAYNELRVKKSLVIVPGATHLFEEPGKLEEVAELAKDWFLTNLAEEAEEEE